MDVRNNNRSLTGERVERVYGYAMPFLAFLLAVLPLFASPALPSSYAELKAKAEASYAEKSFRRAHEFYEAAAKLDLPKDERRWVDFRLADSRLRERTPEIDKESLDALAELIRVSGETHDRVWAEAHESLGDSALLHGDFAGTEPHYRAALDWWAASDDIALARNRYLAIVWRFSDRFRIPNELLANAVDIAATPGDRNHAHFLLGKQLIGEGKPESVERGLEHLDAVIRAGRGERDYGEALFTTASTLANLGNVVVANDKSEYRKDYVRALELYRRIVAELKPGEAPHFLEARQAIDEITKPSIQLYIGGNVPSGADQLAAVHWRNVDAIELTLHAIDLTNDLEPKAAADNGYWSTPRLMESIVVDPKRLVRRWSIATYNRGDYMPGTEIVKITPRLEPGAYVLTAQRGATTARDLLLVSDTAIVTHELNGRLHVYVGDLTTGAPVPHARVRVFAPGRAKQFDARDAVTNADGIAAMTFDGNATMYGPVYVTASDGHRQAYNIWNTGFASARAYDRAEWRIYAFTDRTAYRPGETVHWKAIARTRTQREWTTPAGEKMLWRVIGPRSEEVASGEATLNAFGSVWADVPVTAAMPLGSYSIEFRRPGQTDGMSIGHALLFDLEEYKLPEFRVSVTMPKENGKAKVFRLGDTIEATIEANYYFGGAVAGADVDADVTEYPYAREWMPWRKYGWYYEDTWRGRSSQMKSWQAKLHTDANGRAVLRIPTTRDGEAKHFYIIASVTDASRREVEGSGDVAVMKQRYSVLAHAEHVLRKPNERASIDFNAADANDEPVQTTGTVTLNRRAWNKETKAYTDETVMTTSLTTNAKGTATFSFTPARTGFYTARWASTDDDPSRPAQARDLVTAEGSVWVSERTTRDFGYHSGGLDLIVDRDTFRAGETAAVLIAAPTSGRWVLLSTATDDLDTQLVHLEGTTKLLEIPIDARHAPNFFLTASSLFDRKLATETKRLIVPPAEKFVNVDITADHAEYEPRQKGTLHITTRDAAGKPVAAEVSVAVSDDAVTAIAPDATLDPRQYFYNDMRYYGADVASSVGQGGVPLLDFDGIPTSRDPWMILQSAPGVQVDRINVGGNEGGQQSVLVTAEAPLLSLQATGNYSLQSTNAVQVRHDFRTTAFWQPDVVTNANGEATVSVDFPEGLTTWTAKARAATAGASFGMARTTAKTNLPLLVRLQAPRFFVAGDRATISAVVNNLTDTPMRVAPALEVEGVTLEGRGEAPPVDVPAHGEQRVDWNVVAGRAGEAKLRVIGRGDAHSDAMEKTFTVVEHGVDKLIARSAKIRAAESVVHLDLPHERRATTLTVRVAPSIAMTMLDALPYLLDYPYGCTEQTMSRFLPAAVVARTLRESGLDPKEIEHRLFGGIEPATADVTHPKGRKDLARLDEVAGASMTRLYDFQHQDGGWGWWQNGSSDDFMTAYVVWGFSVAKKGGLAVNDAAINRAMTYLETRLDKARADGRTADEVWMLYAITSWRGDMRSVPQMKAFDDAWLYRDVRLTPYSRALLTLVAHRIGNRERAEVLARNLENGVQVDRSEGDTMATAHWGNAATFWWHWYEGPVETTAFTLQALLAVDPHSPLIEPAMNWLVKNRRGAQWNNTRDTAVVLLALNDYLRVSGELKPDIGYELAVNGHVVATRADGKAETFTIDPALVRDGNDITIRRTHGDGPLYVAAEGRFVSLEEPVKAASHEMSVKRDYYRVIARPTLLKGVLYDKQPLGDGETLASGDRVEVVVTVDTKNDYDYLMFEDLKPAGLEATTLQSGLDLLATSKDGGALYVYQELRDRKVTMFVDHLPQGTWTIRYTLRAEVPGTFHALPLLGEAMYVPEVRANGEEWHVVVE